MRRTSVFAAVLLSASAAMAQDSDMNTTSDTSSDTSSGSSVTVGTSSDTPTDTSSSGSYRSQGWSLVSAQTVGSDRNFIHVQAGYPGIFGSFVHGMNDTMDLGGKFGFIYGSEGGWFGGFGFGGLGFIGGFGPGIRAQAVVRWLLSSTSQMKMGLEIEPGLYTQFFGFGGVSFGIIAPIKFTLAFPITSAFAVHAGADLPLLINIANSFNFSIPILLGGGLEYFINDSISLTLRLRFGPSININTFTNVSFGLDTLAGVSFRI